MKIKKDGGGAGAGNGGAAGQGVGTGLGTVHTADGNPGIFTPTYGEREKKKKDAEKELKKLQEFLSKKDGPRQKRHYGEDTGELNKPGEIPGVPEHTDPIEWDKKKNPDHKTTMPMEANTSTTYWQNGVQKGFGDPKQDDDLKDGGEGEQDELDTDEERYRKRSEQSSTLAGNAPEPIPSVKSLPGFTNPGMEIEAVDSKQKKKFSEEDHENTFIGRFEKMVDLAKEGKDTLSIVDAGNDDQNYTGGRTPKKNVKDGLDQPQEPPTQNNQMQVLGN